MKHVLIFFFFCFFCISVSAQIIKTNNAYISFYSSAPLEDIEAHNYNVSCVFDKSNNQIAFLAKIINFDFAKKLMKKHFCEKYMEEEDFPFSSFSGSFIYSSDSSLEVVGVLEIHGQKNEIKVKADIVENTEKIILKSEFYIQLDDYKIKIPKIVKDNISKLIRVNVIAELIK